MNKLDKTRLLKLAGLNESVDSSPNQEKGHHVNIEKETLDNNDYRRVLFTTKDNQLVVMSLKPEEEIGEEVHNDTAQFIRIESGKGKVTVGDVNYEVSDGDSVIVPRGIKHNVVNTGERPLKLYTVYSPGVHEDGLVQKKK